MFCVRTVAGITSLPPSSSSPRSPVYSLPSTAVASATLKVPLDSRIDQVSLTQKNNGGANTEVVEDGIENKGRRGGGGREEMGAEGEEEEVVSGIQVPRLKYIAVSKSELLNGIKSTLVKPEDDDADLFLLIASCLESILHAEHKIILEQMRADYNSTQSMDEDEESSEGLVTSKRESPSNEFTVNGEKSGANVGNGECGSGGVDGYETCSLPFTDSLDLWNLLASSRKNGKRRSRRRVAAATRFQRYFMQLLRNAQFEELSAADLALTSALNTDYLLTLPIYVDWKRAARSNAIIFRRGYATERQKGLLIVEKLDYLQSKLLRGIISSASKPLRKVGKWIKKALSDASQTQEIQEWIEKLRLWLKELSYLRLSNIYNQQSLDNLVDLDQLSDSDLPIWLAAQRAVSRYEGLLSPVGPRQKLFRKLLGWIGLVSPAPEAPSQLESHNNVSEPYLRPIFLSRITLSDIWQPASKKFCGNDVWKRLKRSLSILLSPSTLQEPAFQELILLYTKEGDQKDGEDRIGTQMLQLKIYERILIPDLAVIFPHKKLYFRIIDTVRLDVATILGLLAFFINNKFEDILSSPSAIFLDVVAVTALIIYAIRVALGYKQTWDRYQLLVNKTLYEKTLASGFGSVHFLLDASEQQQYKEAILIYAILLNAAKSQAACPEDIRDKCERFLYNLFKAKVEMPVEKALNTLVRLGLVTETSTGGDVKLQVVPCAEAYNALKERWNSLLG